MTERWYLRINSAAGPLYYAGTYLATGEDDSRWSSLRASGVAYESPAEAHADRDVLLGNSPAVRVVRVGPPRRYTLTEKGRAATEPARQRVDGTSDGSKAVPSPSARPEGNGGAPKRYAVGFTLDGKPDGDVAHWAYDERCEHVLTFATADEARAENDRRGWPGYVREYPCGSRVAPTAAPAPAVPERVPVTGTWCADSPVHEHAWQWRDGGLVCAHCGGRRVEVKA